MQIKESTGQIEDQMTKITSRLEEFDERFKAAERKMSDSKLSVNSTLEEANNSLRLAEEAREVEKLILLLKFFVTIQI